MTVGECLWWLPWLLHSSSASYWLLLWKMMTMRRTWLKRAWQKQQHKFQLLKPHQNLQLSVCEMYSSTFYIDIIRISSHMDK